ncbi:MAG: glycogen synthase GlgA [Thermoplasmata archaeon]
MKILFAAAEAYPFAKTGGLGDVAGSLPKALSKLGHEVNLIMPRYRGMDQWRVDLGPFNVTMGDREEVVALKEANLTPQIPVLMVDHLGYFDRERIYGYKDDGRRFALFSRAILEACRYVDFYPNVIHCNDWHTALVSAYLTAYYRHDERFDDTRVLFTIHNLHHQGSFPTELLAYLGLPEETIERHLLHRSKVNFMKAGISLSDGVSTVSETYAKEIQTPEYGHGLHQVLRQRGSQLYGVLNGLDGEVWNPQADSLIPRKYDPLNSKGKETNKRALQREIGLNSSSAPLMGFIARLVKQKGMDLLQEALPKILSMNLQLVILGTGRERFEEALQSWKERSPNLSVNLRYDEGLAHRIYAGADMFLMPSRFEPCGLGQMISMRYGTVPVVRRTGGLADTVVDYALGPRRATGFTFDEYKSDSLLEAVDGAVSVYHDRRAWRRLLENCSRQDHSWDRSSRAYEGIYRRFTQQGPEVPP